MGKVIDEGWQTDVSNPAQPTGPLVKRATTSKIIVLTMTPKQQRLLDLFRETEKIEGAFRPCTGNVEAG